MEVYILRHAIAENRRPGRLDAERRLTAQGRDKLRQVLHVARAAGVKPSLILTSPYKRAAETAEIAAEVLRSTNPIVQSDALLPSSSPEAVWRLIHSNSEESAILLAGHEPLLGETASYLLGAPRLLIDLKKSALLRIDVEESAGEPRGMLQWLLTAKLVCGVKTGFAAR
jgi:phosphohistidine phosphatase